MLTFKKHRTKPSDARSYLRALCLLAAAFAVRGNSHVFAQCGRWQKATATDAAANAQFGIGVAVSGDTAVVGADGDGCDAGVHCGAAYVYRYNGASWIEEQKLVSGDSVSWDFFGDSVAVSGNTIVVGAFNNDCPAGPICGAAYVYRFNGTSWVSEQKLAASDATGAANFGFSVAVSGDTIVVGAVNDDRVGCFSCGAAYVYRFNGTSWVEEQRLVAFDTDENGHFGTSVAVDGAKALVGAYYDDCVIPGRCGSAYVFRFDGNHWVEEQKLKASDEQNLDEFGGSVALHGDTAVVGYQENDCPFGPACGAAYVYRYNGTSWVEEQKLTSSDPAGDEAFGISVSVSGDRIIVGTYGSDCLIGVDCGAAYLFQAIGGSWVEVEKLVAFDGGAVAENFGFAVSISGDAAWMGAFGDGCGSGPSCGAGYAYCLGSACQMPLCTLPLAKGIDDQCYSTTAGTSIGLSCGSPADCPPGYACHLKNRFVTVVVPPATMNHSIALELLNVSSGSVLSPSDYNGTRRFVGTPFLGVNDGVSPAFNAGRVQCALHVQDWSAAGQLHIYGDVVVPGSTYAATVCDSSGGNCSTPLSVATATFGAILPPHFGGAPNFQDVQSIVAKFQSAPSGRSKTRTDLVGRVLNPNDSINFQDVSACVAAFQSKAFRLVVTTPPIICP